MATGKFSKFPSTTDDVLRSTAEDARSVRNAFGTSAKGAAKTSVENAAKRAGSRIAGRLGAAGAAASLGWDVGRAIDKTTGIGKKIVDSTVGDDIENSITRSPDRATLTADAKRRLAAMDSGSASEGDSADDDSSTAAAPTKTTPKPPPKPAQKPKTAATSEPKSSVREGSNANIGDDTRKRAMESVGMEKGGTVRGYGTARGGRPCKMR